MQESYVHVRWGWLALPAGVLRASIGVLVVCILYNERGKIVLWKPSNLALLFHSLDSWEPQDFSVGSVGQLDAVAKKMRVQMWDDEILRFTKA